MNQFAVTPHARAIWTAGVSGVLTVGAVMFLANCPARALDLGSLKLNLAPRAAASDNTVAAHTPGDVEMGAAMNGLAAATPGIQMTGQVDADFMLLMIPHHDAGIAMSSAEADLGEHKSLKDMAVLDVHDQTRDNREMRSYLQHSAGARTSASNMDTALLAAMKKMLNPWME